MKEISFIPSVIKPNPTKIRINCQDFKTKNIYIFYKIYINARSFKMHPRISGSRIPANNNSAFIITYLIFLLSAYLTTALGLLILALLLYKIPLSDSAVNIGIVIVYILSTFFASFLCGRKLKTKKFLWGLLIGIGYFLILILISLAINQSTINLSSNLITTFLICAGAGMLGGMLA